MSRYIDEHRGRFGVEPICRVLDVSASAYYQPATGKRAGQRPGWDGGLYASMRRVLATEHGGGLYRKRQAMIEPVFGHTKFNRKIDRFQRRGRAAARSEWRLVTATHNLMRLYKHTTAPQAA